MNRLLKIIFLFALFFTLIIIFWKKKTNQKFVSKDPVNIITIKFDPESAIEFPFDSLFKSIEIIDLQRTENSKLEYLDRIHRTDSLLIVNGPNNYLVFDLKGTFMNKTGSKGTGSNSNISLGFFFANNKSILSIWDTKWIKYNLNGTTIDKGKIDYSIFPKSFILLNDSTWLLYHCHIYPPSDTLRLWTTDLNFKIRKEYLFFDKNFPTGGSGLMKFIHQTENGIYITDRVVDTIYKFINTGIEPIYVFNFGDYQYYRKLEMRELKHNEVACMLKLVTTNAVLFKILMNNQCYFVYHNRINNSTKTIKKLIDGPDLINSWLLKDSDNEDRLYWVFNIRNDILIDDSGIKHGYSDLLNRTKDHGSNVNPFLLVTTLR